MILRRAALLVLTAFIVGGCSSGGSPTPAPMKADFSGSLDLAVPTQLRLRNFRKDLQLGETVESAFEVFPAPAKSYPFSDLPPGLKPPFEARGWETTEGGFGVITFEGRIAIATRQYEHYDLSKVDALVEQVRLANRELTPKIMVGQKARFWMWVDGGYRLLISVLPTSDTRGVVSVSLGDYALMDYLGLQPSESNSPATEVPASPEDTATGPATEPSGELGGGGSPSTNQPESQRAETQSESTGEMGGQPVDRGQGRSDSFFVPPPATQNTKSSL